MKIWIHKKTGIAYPSIGGGFVHYPDYKAKPNKFHCFIRGSGWKHYPAKDWESKEIPDLENTEGIRMFPNIFRAYVKEYGIEIAQAQLYCADFCKSSWAAVLLDPNYPDDDIQKWFYETFNPKNIGDDIVPEWMKKNIWDFMIPSLGMITGKFFLDINAFEQHLVREFDYDPSKSSMADFVKKNFGIENCNKFENTFFKSLTFNKEKSKVTT